MVQQNFDLIRIFWTMKVHFTSEIYSVLWFVEILAKVWNFAVRQFDGRMVSALTHLMFKHKTIYTTAVFLYYCTLKKNKVHNDKENWCKNKNRSCRIRAAEPWHMRPRDPKFFEGEFLFTDVCMYWTKIILCPYHTWNELIVEN